MSFSLYEISAKKSLHTRQNYMITNIIMMIISYEMQYDLKDHFYVMVRFSDFLFQTFKPFD